MGLPTLVKNECIAAEDGRVATTGVNLQELEKRGLSSFAKFAMAAVQASIKSVI